MPASGITRRRPSRDSRSRTKPMKTSPLTAINILSAMVERVDLAFLTRPGVAVATIATVSPATGADFPGECEISR